MKNRYLIFIAIVGLFSLFACEKEEEKAVLKANITAPTLEVVPNLSLERDNASNAIVITGTNADFGYNTSANYILEVATSSDFEEPIELANIPLVNNFEFTVSSLNAVLIQSLPEDETASLHIRVRAVVVSSETGGNDPIEAISASQPLTIKTYGPPSLYLTDDANTQRAVSLDGDGIYTGWVYTDGTAFTLTNRDDSKVYGATGGTVSEGGAAIALEAGGYDIEVNLNTMTFEAEDVTIEIIGDAAGGWGDGDATKMTFDFSDMTWNLQNQVIVSGGLKFRTHRSWSAVNVAYDPAGHDLNNLYQSLSDADSENIDDVAPGTYNIKLSLETTPMWVTFTPAK